MLEDTAISHLKMAEYILPIILMIWIIPVTASKAIHIIKYSASHQHCVTREVHYSELTLHLFLGIYSFLNAAKEMFT